MTIRETLTRLGLSQTGAARLLGVSPRTVRGWCEAPDAPGHRTVPAPIWLLLDLIEHVPGVKDYLLAAVPPPPDEGIRHPNLPISMILPSDKPGGWMAIWRGIWLGTYSTAEQADAALTSIDRMSAHGKRPAYQRPTTCEGAG